MSSIDSSTQVAALAAWLCTSKNFPYAAKAGEILRSCYHVDPLAPSANIDKLLANLQRRYHTPIPEAYLSESIAAQQSQRRQHGVYYTPWPLAQYLTRSAQEIAQQEFPDVTPTWLDPACGAGVFFLSLQNNAPKPAGLLLGWENSPTAAALCRAIIEARGLNQINVECRNALLYSPSDKPVLPNAAPLLVVGNPPYSNFGKRELSPWLTGELHKYRPLNGEKKTNLRDAFLLFLRLAESLIGAQGHGILAMVLSTTFLDAITHCQVRDSLLSTFDELRVLRLESPGDLGDENLFSIRQPTAACLFLRRAAGSMKGSPKREGRLFQARLEGTRDHKLAWLTANTAVTTEWIAAPTSRSPSAPLWYSSAPPIPDYFSQYISGVQTKNDTLFLARSRTQLESQIRERFQKFDAALVQPILASPFDPWWVYYDPDLLGRARYSVMRHMLGKNLALIFMRQATSEGEYDHFLVTRSLVTDRVFHSRWGAPFLAPLDLLEYADRRPNVQQPSPERWLAFMYALVHSRWYRQTAAIALRSDFPRVPLSKHFDSEIVTQLTELGTRLIELHATREGWLAFQGADDRESTLSVGRGYPRIEAIDNNVRVLIGSGKCIAEVSSDVWSYRIGGVHVLKRFLLRRRGRKLLLWEVEHFNELIRRLVDSMKVCAAINSIGSSIAETVDGTSSSEARLS